jgi:microcystin-dependent protein
MNRSTKRALAAAVAFAAASSAPTASATCTTEPYLGSICIVAFTYCPRGYADAAGQLLSIAQNTALFSLLGTTYGGNGVTTFALPDLRGRFARGIGQGPGLPDVTQGEQAGTEQVTLITSQLPAHTHSAALVATEAPATTASPRNALPARPSGSAPTYAHGTGTTTMAGGAVQVGATGSNVPVGLLNPYLALRFCIAIEGLFPPRN